MMTRSRFTDSRRPYFWCEQGLLNVGLSPTAVAIYCALAARANQADQCWPSQERIARQLGITRRTVIRGIRALCQKGLVKKTPIYDKGRRRGANLYELVDLPDGIYSKGRFGGDIRVTIHGDKRDTPMVTNETHPWCHQSTSNKEPLNKEAGNEEGAGPPPDLLLDMLAKQFEAESGHPPTLTGKQMDRWADLRRQHPASLLKAKIAAWPDHPLPRSFTGNRTFGAFLQWFDDIVIERHEAVAASVLTAAQLSAEMRAGSPLGRERYRELIGEITDRDAKARTLIACGEAPDLEDAHAIIAACDPESA